MIVLFFEKKKEEGERHETSNVVDTKDMWSRAWIIWRAKNISSKVYNIKWIGQLVPYFIPYARWSHATDCEYHRHFVYHYENCIQKV